MAGRKQTALDLAKLVDKTVMVKLQGGREVTGVLKGYDEILNLVLDETVESLRDPADAGVVTDERRPLGLTVCRGTCVTLVAPADGLEPIANPFVQ